MTDRFKFRIWDVQEQKYLYFDLLNKGSLSDFEYFATEESPDYNEQIECPDTNCWALIMEQCTGLRDKNDKLIFEGDFVKAYGFNNSFILICCFKSTSFCLCYTDGRIYNFVDSVAPIEVIGNVHENPELLEQNNDD